MCFIFSSEIKQKLDCSGVYYVYFPNTQQTITTQVISTKEFTIVECIKKKTKKKTNPKLKKKNANTIVIFF